MWLRAAVEGRLASDPRRGPGWIEAVGGRILELGQPEAVGARGVAAVAPAVEAAAAAAPPSAAEGGESPFGGLVGRPARRRQRLEDLSNQLGASLVATACFFGFIAGANSGLTFGGAPPPPQLPPPPPAAIMATPRATLPSSAPRATTAARVSLTVDELRQRQALRVEGDRLELARLGGASQRISTDLRARMAEYEARLDDGQRALDQYRTSGEGRWSYAQGRAVEKTVAMEAMRQRLIGSDDDIRVVRAARREALATLKEDSARLESLGKLQVGLHGARGERLYDADRAMWDRLYNTEPANWQNSAPSAPEYLSLSGPYRTLGARSLAEQVAKQTERLGNIDGALQQFDKQVGGALARAEAGAQDATTLRRSQLVLERKWAEQNLAELRRVQAQRGGQSAPVELGYWTPVGSAVVFPSS